MFINIVVTARNQVHNKGGIMTCLVSPLVRNRPTLVDITTLSSTNVNDFLLIIGRFFLFRVLTLFGR